MDGPYPPFEKPVEVKEERVLEGDWPEHLDHRPPVPAGLAAVAKWRAYVKEIENKKKRGKRKKKASVDAPEKPKPKKTHVSLPETHGIASDRGHDDDYNGDYGLDDPVPF